MCYCGNKGIFLNFSPQTRRPGPKIIVGAKFYSEIEMNISNVSLNSIVENVS